MFLVAVLFGILILLSAFTFKRHPNLRYGYKLVLALVVVTFCLPEAHAQKDTLQTSGTEGELPGLFSVGLGVQYGFIFAHSQDVQNTRGANPVGAEVILSWQHADAPTWGTCHCFPRNGLLLAYYNFDNAILGKGLTSAYFLEPTYKIGKNAFFSFKGSAGIAYLTNPHHKTANPANQSYSTSLNGYLLVGVGAWFRLNEHWWLNPSVNYQHISNGGFSKPNKGINWPTAGVALSYQPSTRPYYTQPRPTEKFWRNYSPRWDVSLFGIARRGYDAEGNRKRFPMAGVEIQGAKQVGRISNIVLGAEAYLDWELRNRLQLDKLEASPVKAGIMLGHEFILGQFLFSQRIGIYAFDQTPYYNRLYHRWGLIYHISPRLGAGFNLLAHRQVAEFIDIRISYSFQRK